MQHSAPEVEIVGNGSEYATVADILSATDLAECDVFVRRWGLRLRVRGLSLEAQLWIDRHAGVGDKRDWLRFAAATLHKGIIRPTFTLGQAEQLREKNPVILDELVNFISGLSALDIGMLDALVAELTTPDASGTPDS